MYINFGGGLLKFLATKSLCDGFKPTEKDFLLVSKLREQNIENNT